MKNLLVILTFLMSATCLDAASWIVRPHPGIDQARLLETLGEARIVARGRAAPLFLVESAERPRPSGAVLWAEPNRTLRAHDASASGKGWLIPVLASSLNDLEIQEQTAYLQVDVAGLQDTTSGSGVLVAVVDSGADFAHPDARLGDALVAGWDWIDGDGDPTDQDGHGTRICGVLAGVLDDAQILVLRVLDENATGTYFDVADAITYAADQGVDVINLSLGGPADSQALRDAVAYARSLGANVVAAAGNEDGSNPQYPAAIPEVVSVTGVDSGDVRADFAAVGDQWAATYGSSIDVSAPAIGVKTTSWPDDFVSVDGTSLSTALASASLAGARATGKTRDEAEDALLTGSVDVDALNPGYEGRLGVGRIDAASTVQ